MVTPNDDEIDLYNLLSRADELIQDSPPPQANAPEDSSFPFEEETPEQDPPILYRNAANGYGQRFRNAANHYGAPAAPTTDSAPSQIEQTVSSIHAYNADFLQAREHRLPRTIKNEPTVSPDVAVPSDDSSKKAEKKRKKRRGCLRKLLIPVVILCLAVFLIGRFITPQKTDSPIGHRKSGAAAILLCGADIGGVRTDTMMLLYVDGHTRQAGLLTLPRDTYTVTAYGDSNKLNSAYGRNGCGEEGMNVLLDYVQDTIGYRPDGYILVELPALRDLIDLMGGVDFDVPQEMDSQGLSGNFHLNAGLQHLDGEKALGLLRFRFGYADQDLGRQNVQKDFLKACMSQWTRLDRLSRIGDVLSLFQNQSLSDLSTGNLAWLGLNLLKCGFSSISTDTLPGYSTMIGDQSYYVLYPDAVADLVQEKYNPYQIQITRSMLHIATE